MIQVLGAYGAKSYEKNSVCFKIADNTIIDAGNIFYDENFCKINTILLTHPHFDHICDIPFFLDNCYYKRKEPLTVYATKTSIEVLKNHIFNEKIWPDFNKIKLKNNLNFLQFKEIKPNDILYINGMKIEVIQAEHTIQTVGFIINDNTLITGDTYYNEELIRILKESNIQNLIIEVSFPSYLHKLAKTSKHLTPELLKNLLSSINKKINVFTYHLKPSYFNEIKNELELMNFKIHILNEGDILDTKKNILIPNRKLKEENLLEITNALSFEKNMLKILEKIVTYSRELTNADGGTLYIKSDDVKYLEFKVLQNESLNIFEKGNEITWKNVNLYDKNNKPNIQNVAALCALTGEIINLPDAYHAKNFNFDGTKKFDKMNNYKSESMLVIPLKNHEDEIIGVLQLINKKAEGKIVAFTKEDEKIIKTLAGAAAVSITKDKLIHDFEKLFHSFIKTIGIAIDRKSKHTIGHIRKVAELAEMIALQINRSGFKNIHYNKNELETIKIAGWLHDIGKITVPEYVLDKSSKLETLYDRINEIKLKFELYKKELEIKRLKKELSDNEYQNLISKADEYFQFLKKLNKGYEYVTDDKIRKLREISELTINNRPLLSDDEIKYLSVRKGTLTKEEFEIIKSHAKNGYEMLKEIYFPKKYKRVVDIAANHHEKLNGKGYPRGLSAKDLSVEERLMAIADIFEALSAKDRPYKEPKKLSEIFKILYFMAKNEEIDKDIVALILKTNLYLEYAKKELNPEQIDEIPEYILNYFLKEEK